MFEARDSNYAADIYEGDQLRSWKLLLGLVFPACLFAILSVDILTHGRMIAVDLQLAAYLHARATPVLNLVMVFITYFGSLTATSMIAFGAAIYFWRHQQRGRVWLLTVAVPGGMLINGAVKLLVQRVRPVFEDPILTLSSYSFPSGHAMAATVLYGLLAVFAAQTAIDLRQRILAGLIAAFLIGLICFSRVYLGVHYLTDVLAGVAEGLGWGALCLALLHSKISAPG